MKILNQIAIGNDRPAFVEAIIEIPKGSRAKYEVDEESGLLRLDRVLYSAMYYPANYGFIPQTIAEDGDPLDILVLCQIDLQPLCLVRAKVIGVIRMSDDNETDDKVIAVAAGDMSVNHIEDIHDLPRHFKKELTNFFEEYKKLEGKTVVVQEILDKKGAYEIIENCHRFFLEPSSSHT